MGVYKTPGAVFVLALAFFVLLSSLGAGGGATGTGTNGATLEPEPRQEDVYFLGNSMFGTGLDVELARELLPDIDMQFAYYDGHYTSMWYLAATLGFDSSNMPDIVVWGFRPTYAYLPAFRQNRLTAQVAFERQAGQAYVDLLANAGSQPLTSEVDAAAYTEAVGGSAELFELMGRRSADQVADWLPSIARRAHFRDQLEAQAADLVRRGGAIIGIETFDEQGDPLKPTDLLVSYTTNGEIQRADALVVDAGERFVTGSAADFYDSFVPRTVEAFDALGVQQLVVIFKPRGIFSNQVNSNALEYYEEARAYLDANGLAYVDFLADETLTEDFFASGDHFTQAGRELITRTLVDAIAMLRAEKSGAQ